MLLNPADVAMSNSKAKLDQVIPTRQVRRRSDNSVVTIDERQFDAAVFAELDEAAPEGSTAL